MPPLDLLDLKSAQQVVLRYSASPNLHALNKVVRRKWWTGTGRYPQCSVIDWSLGRLACIRAQGVEVETLAEIIRDVAEAAWDERITVVDASYEEMGRA